MGCGVHCFYAVRDDVRALRQPFQQQLRHPLVHHVVLGKQDSHGRPDSPFSRNRIVFVGDRASRRVQHADDCIVEVGLMYRLRQHSLDVGAVGRHSGLAESATRHEQDSRRPFQAQRRDFARELDAVDLR